MKKGFSLVELSIVLVILGLLTGGILTGQTLIRAAELRAITTEFQNYQSATNTFRDKYFAIPGDMRNAEQFWGTMSSGSCPNATGGIGTQTCNGNGDGTVRVSGTPSQSNETFTFWQHLANASLIEGRFTGIAGTGNELHAIIGENSPTSRMSNVTWNARFLGEITSNTIFYDNFYGNIFTVGRVFPNSTVGNSFLTPQEAWNIDIKLDDGQPGTGLLVAAGVDGWNDAGGTLERCTLSASGTEKDKGYYLNGQAILCYLIFVQAF